jgi:murein DD-endopeptidase MepM/ murein hydrolase activator NlpD
LKKATLGKIAIILCAFFMMTLSYTKVGAFPFISFSILNNISPSQTASEKAFLIDNSQNIAVLEPANHIDPNPAKGGGDISVVEGKALYAENSLSGVAVDINKPGNTGRISVYEVRPGDTLTQIAEMFDVSVNTIRWANDFSGDIKPGQSLVILPVSGVKHVVKNGGTIKDIADMYGADTREIALFNGLSEDVKLKAGDEIIVPHAEIKHEDSETKTKSKAKTYAKSGTTKSTTVSTSGYFTNPAPGAYLTQGIHGYNAVDLGAPVGTPIYAAAAGSVITSKEGGWNGGYGSMIIISHNNGTQTLYSHMSQNNVAAGQKVAKGELIGYMGSTGKSTGSHLHFEVRGAKNPISAACVVGKACKY